MNNTSLIGQSIRRVDAFEKVTGSAIFGADVRLPNMLHGAFHRSTLPHAKIVDIDVSKAQAVPGVKAVITGKQCSFRHGGMVQDEPFIAIDKVRYAGEAVAGILACDYETAREAAELIKVEYEPLPYVDDVLKALETDAPLIHEGMAGYPHSTTLIEKTNIAHFNRVCRGDVETGFAAADLIEENWFAMPMIQHATTEAHTAIAKYDPSGKLCVWTPAQSPFNVRAELARSLGKSLNQVRIINTRVGGAFGSKHEMAAEPWAVALAAYANCRPVKVVMTRQEVFVNSVVRGATKIWMKTGVKKDGRIVAQQMKTYFDTGAYCGWAPAIARNSSYAAAGPYVVPNVDIETYCVYTNKPHRGAYRGFGFAEVAWGHETQMDIVAHKLGIDPLQMRLLNCLEDGKVSITGETMFSVGLKDSLEAAAKAIGWGSKSDTNSGKGIACFSKMTGTPSSSSSVIKLNEDGTVTIFQSLVDMGQGSETIHTQIVAEELGIPIDAIQIADVDTEYTPYERSTTSSRGTFHTGNAVRNAAIDIRNQLLQAVQKKWQIAVERIEATDGEISEIGGEKRSVAIADLWGKGFLKHPIIGRGVFSTNDIYRPVDPQTGQSKRPTAFWMWGAQAAEVEVDPETGRIEITKIVSANDAGRVINLLTANQQLEGGVVMGVGSVFEELVLKDGLAVNANLHDYKVPTSMDVPQEVVPILIERTHCEGPYGAKGIGEGALAPTAPAIANAVYDATGVRIKELPLSMENVFNSIRKEESSKRHSR
jgi:carbon-monoxide dehydrogenase large subunit